MSTSFNEAYSTHKIGGLQNIQASYKFNNKICLKWSEFICTQQKGEKKISHALYKGPTKNDPAFKAWNDQDSMIMFWLWDSMDSKINGACMFSPMATKINDFIHHTYLKANDATQVYELKVKAIATM